MELSAEEIRVLGCLLEKERTVPDSYPLTLNSLITACNQSTNREPVVGYDEITAERALASLRDKDLARRGVYHGSRVPKHRHCMNETLALDDAECAVLTVLMLRGPQTIGELKSRTERMHPFGELADVEVTIDRLSNRESPLVRRMARQPGQKEARVMHLLGGGAESEAAQVTTAEKAAATASSLAAHPAGERVAALEHEVRVLRMEVDELRGELDRLRSRVETSVSPS